MSALRYSLFFLGLVSFFIFERYFASADWFGVGRIFSFVLVAGGVLVVILQAMQSAKKGCPGEAKSLRYAALWQTGVFLSLVAYVLCGFMLGDAPEYDTFGKQALLAIWVSGLLISLFAGAGIEFALVNNGRGKLAEPARVARSGATWLSIGMLFVVLVNINYVGAKKDKISDWSYLKTTTPSSSTGAMLKTLTDDLEIAIFYPQGNEVLPLLSQYFDSLAAMESKVKVAYYDKDLHPTKAETFKVSRNGSVVFRMGEKTEQFKVGEKLSKARKHLRKLDGQFQKFFLKTTAKKKTAYFTRGHGESSWTGNSHPLKTIREVEKYMRTQNYRLRKFGFTDGSGEDVPDDADVVVIAGPAKPFHKDEIAALKRYVDRGGNLMVFLDVDKSAEVVVGEERPLLKWLSSIGFHYDRNPVANDKDFVRATRSKSDHWFIFSNSFTSHESVTTISRHDERVAVLFFQTGSLKITPSVAGFKNHEAIRSSSKAFIDKNRNFTFDAKSEKRKSVTLAAVGEKKAKEGKKMSRIVVMADATSICDDLLRVPANIVYFAESLKWLVGETDISGDVVSEEDIKIRHTGNVDIAWFYGTVICVPFLVLGAGFVATRRRRKGERHAA